jgi:UDP-N-acetylglucosamine--N-acetylmuramyl-(pentapeptide) pyrophosphoryl-undecaprenol N-acetylglucosamine transferase
MAEKPWFIFAGGGTGGHLFPALGVIEELRRRGKPADFSFFCTQRPIDRDILTAAGIGATPLPVRPMTRLPWRMPGFLLAWRRSVSMCMRGFRHRRPAAVVGAGGYASGPPVAAALKLGIPTFLLNPDAVPGRANRHLGRKQGVTAVLAQWEVTRQHFPPECPVEVVGCPVRHAFLTQREKGEDREAIAEARRRFDLEGDRSTVLVTGASQGARTVNEAMLRLAPVVQQSQWQVLHLSGQGDQQRVAAGYEQAGVSACVLPFTERMDEAMLASDLIISRAGASSLAEILAVGRPSVLFPYPFHRDRHQWHNGQVLVDAGAARMLDDLKDGEANAEQLSPVLKELLTDARGREEMARNARRLGVADAGARIADRLCQVAGTSG